MVSCNLGREWFHDFLGFGESSTSPRELVFREMYEKKSDIVTIKCTSEKKNEALFGELVWIEEKGKYKVGSAIV